MGSKGKSNKIFICESRLAFHLAIACSERIGQALDLHANNDEVVQCESSGFRIILSQDVLHKRGSKSIAHLLKSCNEFCFQSLLFVIFTL